MPRRVCTFAVAHTDISAQPFNNAARTVRIFAPNNLSGSAVYVKFSNYYSDGPVWVGNATIGLADAKGRLVPDTVRPLTVHGDTSFALVPQRDVFSDRVALPVQPGCTIAVSLYYPGGEKVTSGNFVGIFANRSVKGDHCDAPRAAQGPPLDRPFQKRAALEHLQRHHHTLSEVIVEQDDALPAPRVVAMFGDSIMQQGAWVTPFTARLYEHFRGEVSVCNLGIGGNRLLYGATPASRGMYGHAGIERYRYDLLPIEGLTHAVFALGTNDLGHPGTGGAPEEELITVDQYAAAARTIADALHKQGVKVYAGLILPREVNHLFPPEREALRRAINRWIAEEGPFDAVLDLGAPIADTDDGVGMKRNFALPTACTPISRAGGPSPGAIDLSLFA